MQNQLADSIHTCILRHVNVSINIYVTQHSRIAATRTIIIAFNYRLSNSGNERVLLKSRAV
jgi:hypothetical protein